MTAVLKLAPQTGPRSLMLAMQTPWDGSVSLRHWWVSEKLDGIRAYWDGEAFWSREGNQFYPPAWFTAQLPKTPLDGELWLGRGRFYECSGVVKRKTPPLGDVDREGREGCAGVMGALVGGVADGAEAPVGTGFTVKASKNPPALGAVVTIRHKSRAPLGLPREPAFICERSYE